MSATPLPQLRARDFQVWEYQVSHGQLLIRSPKRPATGTSPECATNVDLVCLGVEYMALPRALRGLEIESPTAEELRGLEATVGAPLTGEHVRILVSGGRRFPVVAATFAMVENDWDIFESPFEFRSHFRSNVERSP